jgi:ABC-type transport system involved in multi-copper enzyme maturation permease subunit
MKALLWKDARMSRSTLILGVVLLLLPYLLVPILRVRQSLFWWDYDGMMLMGFLSLILSLLTMTILGGVALAGERADHSAEFLAAMPVSRPVVLLSKSLVVLGVVVVAWVLNVAVILAIAPRMPGAPAVLVPGVHDDPVNELGHVAGVAVLMLGTAWLTSSTVERASTAVAAGLMAPALVLLAPLLLTRLLGVAPGLFGVVYLWTALAVGIGGLGLGSVIFLRRFEP